MKKFKFEGVGWYVTQGTGMAYIAANLTDVIDCAQPLIGLDSHGEEQTWGADGQYFDAIGSRYDLSHKYVEPTTQELYFNIYKCKGDTLCVCGAYYTLDDARNGASPQCVGRKKVTITEGVFDE